jgi:hypothetical protein
LSPLTGQPLRHRRGGVELSPVPSQDIRPPVNLRICLQANRVCRLDETLSASRVSTAKQKGIPPQYVRNESKLKPRAVRDVNPRFVARSGLQMPLFRFTDQRASPPSLSTKSPAPERPSVTAQLFVGQIHAESEICGSSA